MFSPCTTDFNLERHLIPFMQDVPFFAEISRHLKKIPSRDGNPTAAVTYDKKADEICLYWNPEFFESLSNWEIRGVLTHEFYHLVFGHLSARRKKPGDMWNIATDLAINSIIIENAGKHRNLDQDNPDSRPLPAFALIPGQWPRKIDGREMTKEEKAASSRGELISKFIKLQASEYYFNKLQELAQQEKKKKGEKGEGEGEGDKGDDWINSMDNHESWDDMPDEMREYIEGKVKAIMEKAVRAADATSTGWGNIPAEIREDIRRSVGTVINWRSVLRQFIGCLVRGHRTTSIKRINRRYPYVHPGVKRGYVAKLLIAMDQSGSVSNEWVEEFFSELSTVTKKVDVTLLPFDCHCSNADLVEWKKGQSNLPSRVKAGGTDFDAPTRVFNDPQNRGRWDGLLIMTDGGAGAPGPCRARRGWVLAKGTQLMFPTDELTITMSKDAQMTGAWRALSGDDI